MSVSCVLCMQNCACYPGGSGLAPNSQLVPRHHLLRRWCPCGRPGLIHRSPGFGPVGIPACVPDCVRAFVEHMLRANSRHGRLKPRIWFNRSRRYSVIFGNSSNTNTPREISAVVECPGLCAGVPPPGVCARDGCALIIQPSMVFNAHWFAPFPPQHETRTPTSWSRRRRTRAAPQGTRERSAAALRTVP